MDECSVGVLVDLSEPNIVEEVKVKSPPRKGSNGKKETDKENDNPLTDSIEIERSADRRNSFTLSSPNGFHSRILHDITQESTTPANLKHPPSSPEIQLIEDEEFDFDMAMSPGTRSTDVSRNDIDGDEEVFFGPVGFTEKCVSVAVSENAPLEERIKPMSPLSAAQVAELVKEANLVAYRISAKKPTSPDSDEENKFANTTTNNSASPAKTKHVRKGTFTESPNSVDNLPDKVKESLPVIDGVVDLKKSRASIGQVQVKAKDSKQNNAKSKLAVPRGSKLPGAKVTQMRSRTKLFKTGSLECLHKGDVSGTDTDDTCSVSSDTNESSVSQLPVAGNVSKPTTRRSIGLKRPSTQQSSGSGRMSLNSTLPISQVSVSNKITDSRSVNKRLSGPGTEILKSKPQAAQIIPVSSSHVDRGQQVPKGQQAPQKSGIPNMKRPLSKLSLIKPGMIQKQSMAANRNKNMGNVKPGNGPMKVTVPVERSSTVESSTTDKNPEILDTVTPIKPDKKVQPKNLSSNFGTPVRSHSVSSSSPASARRRSFLPTPQKMRLSSIGSLPPESPLSGRSSSTSSQKSRCSSTTSIPESPLVTGRSSRIQQPRAMRKSLNTSSNIGAVNCNTPSALKPKCPKVVNTPNLPKRQVSAWSPVKRQRPISLDEEVTRCTKRIYKE